MRCVFTCLACLRAFVPLLLTCLPFLRAIGAFILLSALRALIFLLAVRGFIFLLALRAFTLLSVSNFRSALCPSLFYKMKCGTTHNQPQHATISKNEVEQIKNSLSKPKLLRVISESNF